jgi:hypothetical protein
MDCPIQSNTSEVAHVTVPESAIPPMIWDALCKELGVDPSVVSVKIERSGNIERLLVANIEAANRLNQIMEKPI